MLAVVPARSIEFFAAAWWVENCVSEPIQVGRRDRIQTKLMGFSE